MRINAWDKRDIGHFTRKLLACRSESAIVCLFNGNDPFSDNSEMFPSIPCIGGTGKG